MKINKVETIPISMRFIKTHRSLSGASNSFDYVIAKVYTNEGAIGIGEASAGRSARKCGETQESEVYAIRNYLGPALIGESPFNIERVMAKLESVLSGNRFAKAAIDMALFDLMGKAINAPVYELLGGSYRDSLVGSCDVSLGEPEAMAEEALEAIGKGFKRLKLKVGLDPEIDVKRFLAVRTAVGKDITIGIDANEGWRTFEAIKVIKRIEEFNPAFVEQPVPKYDIDGLAKIISSTSVPIMPDESLLSPHDAINLIKRGAANAFNIKTERVGGLFMAKKIFAIAEGAGIPCMIGCSMELGIGQAAGAHLAASTKIVEFGCEFVQGPFWFEDDILVEPLEFKNGYMKVPRKPGLGVDLDDEKVRLFAKG